MTGVQTCALPISDCEDIPGVFIFSLAAIFLPDGVSDVAASLSLAAAPIFFAENIPQINPATAKMGLAKPVMVARERPAIEPLTIALVCCSVVLVPGLIGSASSALPITPLYKISGNALDFSFGMLISGDGGEVLLPWGSSKYFSMAGDAYGLSGI